MRPTEQSVKRRNKAEYLMIRLVTAGARTGFLFRRRVAVLITPSERCGNSLDLQSEGPSQPLSARCQAVTIAAHRDLAH
jgi:hypothetical protein